VDKLTGKLRDLDFIEARFAKAGILRKNPAEAEEGGLKSPEEGGLKNPEEGGRATKNPEEGGRATTNPEEGGRATKNPEKGGRDKVNPENMVGRDKVNPEDMVGRETAEFDQVICKLHPFALLTVQCEPTDKRRSFPSRLCVKYIRMSVCSTVNYWQYEHLLSSAVHVEYSLIF